MSGGFDKGFSISPLAGGGGGAGVPLNFAQTKGAQVTVTAVEAKPATVVSTTITTQGNPVQIIVAGDANPSAAGSWGLLNIYRDGTAVGQLIQFESSAGNENVPYCLQVVDQPAAGTWTYSLKVTSVTADTQFGEAAGPIITVTELGAEAGGGGGGSVTAVTATPPLASSGGTAPDISITAGTTPGDVLTWDGSVWSGAASTGGIPTATSQYVVAVPGDDIAAKYAAAVALQGGSPSTSSRSTLVIFPGTYTLSATLDINAEYVDVIGLGSQPQRPAVRIEGDSLNVTANDVRVVGIWTVLSIYVGDNLPLQVFTNCRGDGGDSFGGSNNITGVFIDCLGTANSFSGYVSSAGTFIRCFGGFGAFGFDASGYYEDCSSDGQYAFGGGALANGAFVRCTSTGTDTFGGGGGGTASGDFTDCKATGANSFGGGGYATGRFINCRGLGAGSFGGGIGGTSLARGCSGVFDSCIGGLNSFGNSGLGEISGQLYNCRMLYGVFGNADITTVLEYQAVTVTPGSPATFTTVSPHGYSVGDPIRLTTTGTPPSGMLANQTYFIATAGLTGNDFTLVQYPESVGTPPTVDTTDAGTGTQTTTSGRLVNCIDGYNEMVTI